MSNDTKDRATGKNAVDRFTNSGQHIYSSIRSGSSETAGAVTVASGQQIYGFTVLTAASGGTWEMQFVDDGAAVTGLPQASFNIGETYDFHLISLTIATGAVCLVHFGPEEVE